MRIVLMLFFLFSCSHYKHDHNKANHHMHQKGHDELIKSFDNPARDKWQKPLKVISLLGPMKGKRVVDIGSGSGYFTRYFLESKAEVVAADVDIKFLNHIEKSFPKKDYPKLNLMLIEHHDPKMAPKSFDYAFTANTYHHIENRVPYLQKVRDGLKLGGKLMIVDFKKNPVGGHQFGPPLKMRVPLSVVVDELTEAGFSFIQIYNSELEHQYIVIAAPQ